MELNGRGRTLRGAPGPERGREHQHRGRRGDTALLREGLHAVGWLTNVTQDLYWGRMRLPRLLLLGLLVPATVLVWGDQALPDTLEAARASASATDSDADSVPDPIHPASPQPGEDMCPLVPEDLDGIDDQDGCPDSDASVSIATEEQYTVTVSSAVTKTVEIWIQNG